jgi:SAM-dependent methyltransferase
MESGKKTGNPYRNYENGKISFISSSKDHSRAWVVRPYVTLASLYDALLGDRFFPETRRTFEWLVPRYGIRFASVADVACGTGTFVRYLCGFSARVVYGVDRSPEMLRIAVVKNQDNGARFLLQDFSTLQLPHPVDLITCNFDSLNYLVTSPDLLRAFLRFHGNLNSAGHLIFDMITDHPSWHASKPCIEHVITPDFAFVRITRWDPRRRIQKATATISRGGSSYQETHVQRGYPIVRVDRLLAKAKFIVHGIHDFHTLKPATTRTSRAVYVARAGA